MRYYISQTSKCELRSSTSEHINLEKLSGVDALWVNKIVTVRPSYLAMSKLRLRGLPVNSPRFPSVALRPNSKLRFPARRKFSAVPAHQMESADAGDAYFKYMPLEGVERLERYCPGGYHPIAIGDYLHGRYRIVHKLGFGGYSTIWLAKDEKVNRYVAVKVLIADGKSKESNILRQLDSGDITNAQPGKDFISPILDEFVIKGINGDHQCLVTAPASMSLSDAREASYERVFQLPVARAVVAQLVQVVAFLHSRGIVHAGVSL